MAPSATPAEQPTQQQPLQQPSSHALLDLAAIVVQPIIDLKPVAPGTVAQTVTATAAQLQALVIAALGAVYVATDATPPTQVIWYDHDGDVLVHLDQTVVALYPGLVLIALTLETAQTGVGQLTVPLNIGSPQAAAGLLVVTESRPRGPVALVDRWGASAVAAAWRALIDSARSLALQMGVDASGARLVPAALSTDGQTLTVVPQARFTIDAVAGR